MLTPQRAVQNLLHPGRGVPAGGVDPLAASAYVSSGAACSFLAAAVLVGGRGLLGATPSASAAGVAMAVVGTALAIATFLAGMARVGSAWASIASSFELVFTVALGAAVSAIGSVRARWSAGWRWSPERCSCRCSAGPERA
jgi:hypothetical protein